MAQWGLALALGPNYNQTHISAERMKAAHEAVEKGLALAASGPEHERAYLEALSKRFSADAAADQNRLWLAYPAGRADFSRRPPAAKGAPTLWPAPAMIITGGRLFDGAGRPAEGTDEIISTL